MERAEGYRSKRVSINNAVLYVALHLTLICILSHMLERETPPQSQREDTFTSLRASRYGIQTSMRSRMARKAVSFFTIPFTKIPPMYFLVMEKFAGKIITGATFDSFERDPPPRCRPGTRLAIVERAICFFGDLACGKRLLWIVGPAGVGKSAIMQTLAEVPSTPKFTLGASLFFSINGRSDGSKFIATISLSDCCCIAVLSKLYPEGVDQRPNTVG